MLDSMHLPETPAHIAPSTKTSNSVLVLLAIMLCLSMLVACDNTKDNGDTNIDVPEETPNPIVTMTMSNGDVIKMELYYDIAPITVTNFVNLVSEGFYDGLIFHRVINGFMIQGGDPEGTGMGGPGYTIKGEFSANGVKNDLKHTRGVLSMARAMNPNSAGSQFFIMHENSPHLDGQYAAFGKLIEGIEVVDKICSVKTDYNDRPLEPQQIDFMTVQL